MRTSRIAGTVAGGVALAAAVAVGAAAAAAPAADHTLYSKEVGAYCFSKDPADTTCAAGAGDLADVQTGDTVIWSFDGNASQHNAAHDSDAGTSPDPRWDAYAGTFRNSGTDEFQFLKPGDYQYVCQAHPTTMRGTIHVTGDPIEPTPDPTVTPSPTPSATPTPTPIPQPGGHTTTPPPTAHTDTVKPRVTRVKLKALRHGARVRFKLSENATVTLSFRKRSGSHKRLATVRRQVRKGTRSITVHSKKLKKGRYTVELRARDPFGNRSALVRKRLTVRR
jgi:plastocyanin